MPSLGVTFTGDDKQLDATYKRVDARAAQSAKFQEMAAQKSNAAFNTELALLDAKLLKQRAVSEEIERGLAQQRARPQGTAESLAFGITGSEVTRASGMTDRLALLRKQLEEGGDAAATARKEIRMLAGAQGIGAVASAISGAGGGHRVSVTGAIREMTVIFREIAANRGIGRILSSATLLGQYLWAGFLKTLISIPGLIAIAGAAIYYFTYQHLKKLNEAMDKTAESMSKAFGDRRRANVDAMMEAARAAGELKDRIAELGEVHETLAEQLDETLRKMEEEFQMMRKIAQLRGETPAQEIAAEQAMRKQQLELVNQTLEKQRQIAEQSKKSDEDATAAAFTSAGAKDRSARLKVMPGELEEAQNSLNEYKSMVEELQDIVEKETRKNLGEAFNYKTGKFDLRGTPAEIDAANSRNSDRQFVTKSGEMMDLNHAQGFLKLYQSIVDKLPGQTAALEEVQRELAKASEKKAEGDTKAAKDIITLTQKRDTLMDQIGLHDKYDARTSSLEGRRSGAAGDLTGNQRIGAYALQMNNPLIVISQSQLSEQKLTNQKLDKLIAAPRTTQGDVMGAINAPFQ